MPLPLDATVGTAEAPAKPRLKRRLETDRAGPGLTVTPAVAAAVTAENADGHPPAREWVMPLAPTVVPLDPATARLSELIPRFLEFAAAIDRSDYTLDALRLDLALLTRYLGDVVGRDIGLDDLRRYVVWLRLERKNDPRSLRRKVASVKAFFAYLEQEGIRDDDPAERLIYPGLEPRPPEFLESHEAEKLIAAAEHTQWRALVLTLLDTGLKRDEVLALHPADVSLDPDNPDHGYLVIRATDQARRIRARSLPLTRRLAEALGRQLAMTPGDRVFPISVRAVNFIVQTCAERAGLRKRSTVSPQMLRDTYAINEVRQRVAVERSRRAAGASSTELAELHRQHDGEVCDLLGLTPGETNDPIARYRALVAHPLHPVGPAGGTMSAAAEPNLATFIDYLPNVKALNLPVEDLRRVPVHPEPSSDDDFLSLGELPPGAPPVGPTRFPYIGSRPLYAYRPEVPEHLWVRLAAGLASHQPSGTGGTGMFGTPEETFIDEENPERSWQEINAGQAPPGT
jgi:site-specific recombinase XerD